MASINTTTLDRVVQAPPVVSELQSIFNSLDDSALIERLTGPIRRGPKGRPVRVLWRCLITKHLLGIPSTAGLIRTLTNNPWIAGVCGIPSPDEIPHESTFSRFFNRLSKRNMLKHVKNVSRALVRRYYATIPGFGERVAIDSTTLKAWSNGGKPVKSDPEAGWSIKKGTHGRKEFTWGFALHLAFDLLNGGRVLRRPLLNGPQPCGGNRRCGSGH